MSKDHSATDFNRPSGYKSDLEVAETGAMVKSVNTSFGSRNHNAYIMRADKTHEHFYYDPQTQRSGWHGNNYETRNNHPQQMQLQTERNGENSMERRNEFIEGLKVEQETIDRCNEVSHNASQSINMQNAKAYGDDGGREIGDSGPGSLGRESGNKGGINNQESTNGGHGTGEYSSGQAVGGHDTGGHETDGGQGGCGQDIGSGHENNAHGGH